MKQIWKNHKLLASVLAAVLVLALGVAVLIPLLAPDQDEPVDEGLTRGSWAALLGETFGYYESSKKEPYYSDVPSDHPLFSTVQALKEDGILEYEGAFEADNPVLFDEMLADGVKIYGETYLTNRLKKADPTAEDFKDYIRTAVTLSAQYQGDSRLTQIQASQWLTQLHDGWLNREFGNSFVSEKQESVKENLEETEYTLTENTLTLETEAPVQVGEILLLGPTKDYPNGVARKVEAIVDGDGDGYVLTVSTPALEEIFENFTLEFSQTPEPGDFIPAEGITVEQTAEGEDLLVSINPSIFGGSDQILPPGTPAAGTVKPLGGFSSGISGTFFDRSITVSSEDLPFGNKTPLTVNPDFPGGSFNGADNRADGIFLDENNNKKSKFDAGFELECGLRLSDFRISGALNWKGLIYASEFSVSTSLKVTPYFRLRGNAQQSFKLGSIPLQLGYGFSARVDLYVVISIDGEVSVEPTIYCRGSVQKASGSYLPRVSGSAACNTEISVSANLGVQIGPDITLSFLDVVDFVDAYILVGVGASATWNSNTPDDLSVEIYLPTLHVGIGMNEDTLLSVLLDVFGDARHDWAILDNNGGTWRCPLSFTRTFRLVKAEPLVWDFKDGVLSVSGTIPDYIGEDTGEFMPPWFRGTQEDPGTEEEPNSANVEIKKVIVAEGVTHIGAGAFSALSGLEEVVLPSSLQTIGQDAFSGCEELKSITIPDGVTEIGKCAFGFCPNLEQVNLGKGLTKLGAETFYGCSALKEVVLPDSLKTIGMSAFYQCTSLKTVTFGKGLEKMGLEVFYGCSALEELALPEGLERIPPKAFYDCTALKKAVLPASLREIGMLAFGNCRALTECNRASDLHSDNTAFYNCVGLGEHDYGNSQVWEDAYAQRYEHFVSDRIE